MRIFALLMLAGIGMMAWLLHHGVERLPRTNFPWGSQVVHYSPRCAYIVQEYLHEGGVSYIKADDWVKLMTRLTRCEDPSGQAPDFPVTAQDGLPVK
jgi:hypothetical protein